jgi:hypothetical protein
MTNTARGPISARTNLKNQKVVMAKDEKTFTVHVPDGSRRVYHRNPSENYTYGRYAYRLIEEVLANGNKILYEWPKNSDDVWQIRTCSADRSVTYAWARFYPKNEKKGRSYHDFGVETSDGRHFEFKFFYHDGTFHLREIEPDENPTETIHYFDCDGKKIVNAFTWPQEKSQHIDYYIKGKNYDPKVHLHSSDERILRVKNLTSPVGETNHNYITKQFIYDLKQRKTTVKDAVGVPTDYYWGKHLYLKQIDL